MKNYLFLLSFSCIFISCAEEKFNSLVAYNLNGKVSEFSETNYETRKEGDQWVPDGEKGFGNFMVSFNKDGFTKEYTTFKIDNSIDKKYIYNFENGALSSTIIYDGNGKIIRKKEHLVKNGKIYETKEFDSEGNLFQIIKKKHHGDSQTTIETYKKEILFEKRKNKYKNNQLIESALYDEDDKIIITTLQISLNNYDDPELLKITDEEEIEFMWEYEYDEHKNWIKRYEKDGEKVKSIAIRKITYYE